MFKSNGNKLTSEQDIACATTKYRLNDLKGLSQSSHAITWSYINC